MNTSTISRRSWLQRTATGFGALALHDLVQAAQSPLVVKAPRFPAKAKRVIFLFMSGGPSQPDLFDPKDYIKRMHGQKISAPINTNELRVGTDKFLALATQGDVKPRGQSGMMISDLLPHTASIADEICLLRAVHADNNQHQPAALQFHTGVTADVRPSMGSWISYGLGAENQNLPSFISIHPDSDTRLYGSSFLPAAHQGTKVIIPSSDKQSPIDYLADVSGDAKAQRARIDFTQRMNKRLINQTGTDARMEGMIESMETAFRMQTTAPELVDISNESEATKQLYGIGGKDTDKNARACLLARKMSEAGVRFVQVTMGGWDHHGNIRDALPKSSAASDQPCAALIKDLKSRGLLEDTLVIWSGEFGRTPWSQDLSGTSPIEKHGREHQPESFCTWMAGGGIKPGFTFGETDDFGFRPVSGKVHMHDLHATILNQLGLDHEQLTWRHLGRDFRLTDVYGNVVKEILA
ncbi:MAG: DUF1501 domain-containing protein [Prosthecobacter sp.]|uniref:DUF1501 domain-containing protein n=1 Tax=Prosthecobacter sp. TaxID=1965333 RepID=UPI0025DF5B3A|nr:DUF1501 domain-containing protein [Prosthecobacter sp.]MCF7784580.1 DUF1501 domain-containing protein [Prosthecobacter sp.]